MTKQVRDWNKDMKMFESAFRGEQINTTMFVRHGPEAGRYWLGQYAEASNEVCFWKGEATTEKERADKAEKRLDWHIDLLEKWNDQLTGYESQLRSAEAREKKLRDAIEEEVKCHILLGTYKRADELRELLASLYPKEEGF